MKTFDKVATCHYVRASQMFHTNIVRAPALYFLSKTDPIGAVRSNQRVRENWENMGIEVGLKKKSRKVHKKYVHIMSNYVKKNLRYLSKT